MTEGRQIGVALSGGGYRASVWGMGTLLYLGDAGVHREVSTISSVSGGSIANAALGAAGGYREARPADLWAIGARIANRCSGSVGAFVAMLGLHIPAWALMVTGGGLHEPRLVVAGVVAAVALSVVAGPVVGDAAFGQAVTWLYLDVVSAAVTLLAFLVGEGRWLWVGGLVVIATVALWRGTVVGWAIERSLLRVRGRGRTRLSDLPENAEHVFCACDLHGRHHVYFGRDFIYSFGFGLGNRPRLPLGAAMQASANLPAAFAPRPMRRGPFEFTAGRYRSPVLALTDGGVYDNMAEEWLLSYSERTVSFRRRAERVTDPTQRRAAVVRASRLEERTPTLLVVANASGPLGFKFAWTTFVPLLGEVLALLRVKSILYDNGNTVRRRMLVGQFLTEERDGILVHISTDPWKVIADGRAVGAAARERADRAAEVLEATPGLAPTDTSTAPSAGTVLYPLPKGRVGLLMQRSYALAMVLGHVWHGLELVDVPSLEQFQALEHGMIPGTRRTNT